MPWIATTYRREELYEQVWEHPIREVAKNYGISDVALAKICKKLDVPRPGRGYWARIAAGKSVQKPALTPHAHGKPSEHTVSRWHDPVEDIEFSAEAQALLAIEHGPDMEISVPDQLDSPHEWVRKSAGTLRRYTRNPKKARLGRTCLDISTSPATIDRALRIADALLKALESRGFQIEVTRPQTARGSHLGSGSDTQPSRTGVHILGSFIEFSIEEGYDIRRIDRRPRRQASISEHDSWVYTPPPEYHHDPNGRLALRINSHIPGRCRRTWRDGERQRVEHCLGRFIVALIESAERLRLSRVERERNDQIRLDEQLRRQEKAARRELEKTMRAELDSKVADWTHAKSIMTFSDEVESSAIARGENTADGSELGNWLDWARNIAKRLHDDAIGSVVESQDPSVDK